MLENYIFQNMHFLFNLNIRISARPFYFVTIHPHMNTQLFIYISYTLCTPRESISQSESTIHESIIAYVHILCTIALCVNPNNSRVSVANGWFMCWTSDLISLEISNDTLKSLKGVLHPRSVFGLFMHFSQKLQHIYDK